MGAPDIEVADQEEALTHILHSIALEEAALATFINAEGEKIQNVAENDIDDTDELIRFQQSVAKIMRTAIKFQMLLQFKLEDVLEYKGENSPATTE